MHLYFVKMVVSRYFHELNSIDPAKRHTERTIGYRHTAVILQQRIFAR